jgi:formate dehydrogenase iron-sulfur subunit
LACKKSNDLPHPETVPDRLDGDAYTCLESHLVTCAGDEQKTVYVKRQCMNCIHPACVSACTVGALRKEPDGPVVYDAEKCIGCRYCQYACPFGVPTYEWEDPFGLISKCQFCFGRLHDGKPPACVEACPNGALRFGQREELLAQAHAQIASDPGRYVDHVYGETEVGGTSMMYLSPVPFDQLGFPSLDSDAIPHYAEAVMKRTPLVAATVASAAVGLNWVLKQRDRKLARVEVTINDPGGEK